MMICIIKTMEHKNGDTYYHGIQLETKKTCTWGLASRYGHKVGVYLGHNGNFKHSAFYGLCMTMVRIEKTTIHEDKELVTYLFNTYWTRFLEIKTYSNAHAISQDDDYIYCPDIFEDTVFRTIKTWIDGEHTFTAVRCLDFIWDIRHPTMIKYIKKNSICNRTLKTTCMYRPYIGSEEYYLDSVKCSSIRRFIKKRLKKIIINDVSNIIVRLLCGDTDEETDKYYVDDVRKKLTDESHYDRNFTNTIKFKSK